MKQEVKRIVFDESGQDIIVTEEIEVSEEELKRQQVAIMTATQKGLTGAVQAHMDSVAQAKGYDNLLSAVTYAEEPAVPQFQVEGVVFRAWRSAVWEYCYVQLTAVLKGEREVPTAEQLITELPQLVLPE